MGDSSTRTSGCLRAAPARLIHECHSSSKIQEKVMSQFLYLDQIQLELQQQQNALLSQEGERSRGHRLDTKDRTSTFPNLGFSFRHEERKPGTNVLCCKADNGKGKENVHYAQDILIPPSTKFAAFQFGKGDNSC